MKFLSPIFAAKQGRIPRIHGNLIKISSGQSSLLWINIFPIFCF